MTAKSASVFLALAIIGAGCAPASPPTPDLASATDATAPLHTPTYPPPTPTQTVTLMPPTETSTPTPPPILDSLKAVVIQDKLVCRYGPGANYLYLFAFNRGARIRIIGRAEGNHWVLVENEPQRCWVNSKFLEMDGDPKFLRPMYPDGYKIPISPYYGPTTILSAERNGDEVVISWIEVIVSPGKYENEYMFPYLVEVWRCLDGEIVFDTIGSRVPFITVTDESGCDEPSRGRVYIQEKHGYAGPAEILWPRHNPPQNPP
jgi:uncharacterized protein YraI